jgi:hypothetical protein
MPLKVCGCETSPHGVGEQETVQVTPALLGSFTRVAVRPVLFVPSTVWVAGATVIPTDGTSSVAEVDLDVSVADVPVTVTVMSLAGGLAGAV